MGNQQEYKRNGNRVKHKRRQSARSVYQIGIIIGIVMGICVANVLFTMITGIHFRSGENVLAYKSGSGTTKENIVANRGYIYDRNKEIVAQDIESYNLYAIIDSSRTTGSNEAAYVSDFDTASKELAPILGCDASAIKTYLNEAKQNKKYQTEFGTLAKNLTAEQKSRIEALKIPGLEFTKSTKRVYPTGTFASQLIGYADYDYNAKKIKGTMGIEQAYDSELSGNDGQITYQTDSNGNYLPDTKKVTKTAENGNDVYLTIDKNVQVTLEKALSDTMSSNNAQKAWGIVMEADTGKVLAQAGYPTFDLNERQNITNYYNLPSEWAFECGSVMKPLVYATAMNEGLYQGNAAFKSGTAKVGYDASGKLVRTDETPGTTIAEINDALGHDYGTVSLDEGLIRSLNTGIATLLTRYLPTDTEYKYLRKFGIGSKIGIKGVKEASGILSEDNPLDMIMTGFGQSSTVTSYQLVKAFSAIFTDGKMVTPYIIDKVVDPDDGSIIYQGKTKKSKAVISTDTCKQIQSLLKRVVTESYGTARNYAMSDITMMAKTGTGQIVVDGKYSSSIYTSSIMAAAPADKPQIIIYYAFQSSNILYYKTSYFQDVVREALLAVNGYNKASSQTTDNTNTNQATQAYEEYTMPNLVNHSIDYVNQKLNGFRINKVIIGNGNSIIAQYPQADGVILSGENVFLLTDGTNITMPNMVGWSLKDVNAFAKLTGIGLTLKGSGKVSAQSIGIGSPINQETKLTVELQ